MRAWYLLRCKSRQEKRAELNLTNQNWRCYCPMVWVNKSKTVVPKKIFEPLFPGYLFIELEDDVGNWGAISSTRGVLEFVRFGQYPTQVPISIIEKLMGSLSAVEIGLNSEITFCSGDTVYVSNGCFEGLKAIYQCESGKDRAIILLNVLGENTAIKVDIKTIEKL